MINNKKGNVLLRSSVTIPSNECLHTKNGYIYMDGKEVFIQAVNHFSQDITKTLEKVHNVDWFVPHQANFKIIHSVCKKADFPLDKVMYNGNKYGNTSAASVPLAFYDYYNKLKPGDKVLFSAFGAGLRGSSLCLEM
ncbi:MAG: hypothetical protein H6845_00080 [Alphaproteobacteria bacterium]|nr:MAG: hypothetical protein H6845_00080 [Alphaproteobacteria bacterium]